MIAWLAAIASDCAQEYQEIADIDRPLIQVGTARSGPVAQGVRGGMERSRTVYLTPSRNTYIPYLEEDGNSDESRMRGAGKLIAFLFSITGS